MSIVLIPRVRASVISPGTNLPYNYTAGESIPAKSVVCKGESDGKIYLTEATTWTRMPAFGVAMQTKDADKTIQVLQFGIITSLRRDADFSPDDKIFVSTTQGIATKTPPEGDGTIVQAIGRAINSSDVILAIDETVIEIQD